MLKRIAALVGVLMIVAAVPATAKPVSTYTVDLEFSNEGDVLSISFDDYGVDSVSLSMSCGGGAVLTYASTSVDGGSFVAVGPKADRFDVSAQFTADFIDCDGSQSTVSRFVHVRNFVATGPTSRERDRLAGTRTVAVQVDADVSFTGMASQPLSGVLTEVISKG